MDLSDSPEELNAVRWVNESARAHVEQLQRLLEELIQRPMVASYTFKHNFTEGATEVFTQPSDAAEQCKGRCLRNCSSYVVQQAAMESKNFIEYISLMTLNRTLNLSPTLSFGAGPSLRLLSELTQVNASKNPSEWQIQAGGGSGWGFQMYCNDKILLTFGGGGGGGFYADSNSQTISFGGGGGGGLQAIFDEGLSSVSVGGGGGCGTADDGTGRVVCGFHMDDDSEPAELSQILAERLSAANLSSCQSITAFGGGGGGGGTGACCWPFRIGYGYSFSISWTASTHQYREGSKDRSFIRKSTISRGVTSLFSREYNDSHHSHNRNHNGRFRTSGWEAYFSKWFAFVEQKSGAAQNHGHQPHGHRDSTPVAAASGEGKGGVLDNQDWTQFAGSGGAGSGMGMGDGYRYKFDLMGAVLSQSGAACGGMGDWCCVMLGARRALKLCVEANATLVGNTTELRRVRSTGKNASIPCSDVMDHYHSMTWLLNPQMVTSGSCAVQTNSATNFSSTLSSSSSSTGESGRELYSFSNVSLPSPFADSDFPLYIRTHVNDSSGSSEQYNGTLFLTAVLDELDKGESSCGAVAGAECWQCVHSQVAPAARADLTRLGLASPVFWGREPYAVALVLMFVVAMVLLKRALTALKVSVARSRAVASTSITLPPPHRSYGSIANEDSA